MNQATKLMTIDDRGAATLARKLHMCALVNCETIFSEKWLTHLVFGFDGRQSNPGSGARFPQ